MQIKGKWYVRLYGAPGDLKDEISGDNVICTNGKEFLANFLKSASTGAATFTMRYIGVGTGTGGESSSDTALNSELSRVSGTASYTSGGIYVVVATFASGVGTGAITEYGLFSSSTAGTMFSRDVESVINKGASDTLTVTTEITFS